MSDIIGFLERLGGDSQLRHAGAKELAQALGDAGVEERTARGILGGDLAMLAATLNVERTLYCLIYAPKEDEREEEEEEGEDDAGDGEKEPSEVPDDVPRP